MENIEIKYGDNRFSYTTKSSYQYDYGQQLVFDGIELPSAFEVHFANEPVEGSAKVFVGQDNTIPLPDEYLVTGLPIYGWIYLHPDAESGETVYTFRIPVIRRPEPNPEEPTPVEQSVITQAIAALNAAVEQTEAGVEAAASHGALTEMYPHRNSLTKSTKNSPPPSSPPPHPALSHRFLTV